VKIGDLVKLTNEQIGAVMKETALGERTIRRWMGNFQVSRASQIAIERAIRDLGIEVQQDASKHVDEAPR